MSLTTLVLALLAISVDGGITGMDRVGPYKVWVDKIEHCSGPKTRDIGYINDTIVEENGVQILHLNTTLLEPVARPSLKIQFYEINKKGMVRMVNQVFNNICECKFCIDKIFHKFAKFRTTDAKCVLEPGSRTNIINIDEELHTWSGSKSFYGKYKVVVKFYGKTANIGCVDAYITVIKV